LRLARPLGLFFLLAIGCGGGGLKHDAGGDGASAAGQGGAGTAGEGGASGAGQSGASAGQGAAGGQAGGSNCVISVDTCITKCADSVVTMTTNCGSSLVGQCVTGCRIASTVGCDIAAGLCKDGAVVGTGIAGAGGQGGSPACSPGTDNAFATCTNGVLTVSSACPPSSSPAGTCPYGCKYPGQFGTIDVQALCNTEPPDAGCDGVCSDARDGPSDVH
jgi:hypothetical protein